MKAFSNVNPRDLAQATRLARQTNQEGRTATLSGGGSDLLGMIKEHLVSPDVLINLRAIPGLNQIASNNAGVTLGGLTTLDDVSRHQVVRSRYLTLAEAAESVGTPQIRNTGTLGGNVCQRPWCWYYRNGFPCFKAGGNQCFSFAGENQFHAIFGGGPSYIVHPSDTAPALMALDATFRIVGPTGERNVTAANFFVLPRQNAVHENVLANDEVLASVHLPAARPGVRSTYQKVTDREAWTHAVVSAAAVLEMNGQTIRSARVVLGGVAPIPWRLPEVEKLLAGQQITEALAARAGETAIVGARPLSKNAYKVPLVKNLVRRTILQLATQTA